MHTVSFFILVSHSLFELPGWSNFAIIVCEYIIENVTFGIFSATANSKDKKAKHLFFEVVSLADCGGPYV